jgi:D-alanine-D-alanine ligase
MHVALTYDLKDDYLALGVDPEMAAEFDSRVTIDGLGNALEALGHRVTRVGNVFELVKRLGRGERFDLAFNIAEGMHGFAREAQVPALLDAYAIPHVFSDAMVCALTLHKAMTKRVLRDCGIATPEFWLIGSEDEIDAVPVAGELFVKPVAEGTSKGIGRDARVTSREQLRSLATRLLERFRQPVLIERYLEGREVTVGVLGTGTRARAIGTMEVLLLAGAEPGIYSYQNKDDWRGKVDYRLLHDDFGRRCAAMALAAWRALGCRDGGRVDLRADAGGNPQVLEINPLPGMNPETSDLPILCRLAGISYEELVRRIVDSALERVAAGSWP